MTFHTANADELAIATFVVIEVEAYKEAHYCS